MELKLKSIRVIEAIYNEETKKHKPGEILHKESPNEKMSACELEQLKLNLSIKHNVPIHFVHCDFEVIEN